MQESLNASPTWPQLAWGIVAAFVTGGGIVKLWNTYLNRRKPAAEVTVTEATAAEITVRASSSAGDAVMRMMDRLDNAQLTIDRLRAERDGLQLRVLKAEDDAETAQMFVGQLNAAAKLTVCSHYPSGVKLSNFLPEQLNPKEH